MSHLLITGTGSLAKRVMHRFKDKYDKIVAYSRDEFKHTLLPKWVTSEIGDVRDFDRLDFVFKAHKPDTVIMTGALKHVNLSEQYPLEFVKTNILGTENTAKACHLNGVKTAVFVSTDKACNPANCYGATKFIGESIVRDYANRSDTRFVCVRYGNVCRSRGSFVPIWENLIKEGKPVDITSDKCTRFMFSLDDSVSLIEKSMEAASGSLVIPLMDSYKIVDVAKALGIIAGKEVKINNLNRLRPGEKVHEEMLSEMELEKAFYLRRDDYTYDDKTIYINKFGNKKYNGPMISSDLFVNNNMDDLIALLNRSTIDV